MHVASVPQDSRTGGRTQAEGLLLLGEEQQRANYDKPDNQFVAGFIGSPAMNFLPGTIKANGSLWFEGPGQAKLPLAQDRT